MPIVALAVPTNPSLPRIGTAYTKGRGLPMMPDEKSPHLRIAPLTTEEVWEGPRTPGNNRQKAATRKSSDVRRGTTDRRLNPAIAQRAYSEEEMRYIQAVAAYQKVHQVLFPTSSDHLAVAKSIGYVHVPHGYRIVRDDDVTLVRIAT